MNTQSQVTTELRPDVAEINGVIKTTSLKVAEFFGKRHTHVLRAIQNLECSAEFHALNFGLVEYSDAKGEKRPSYEMTKNGFIFLAMGFTGKEAAKWKESYINAFDQLEAQLQQLQKPQYGLKSLASPFISEAEAARFQKSIKAHCAYNGKKYSDCYTAVYDQYGITKYTHIPAGKLEEAARLIGMTLIQLKKQAIPAEPLKLEFTPEELEDLVAERIKSVAGEIMPKKTEEAVQHNSVTINLAPLVDGKLRRWLVTQALDEMTVMQSIRPDQDLRSKTEVLIDVGASKDALKELINQHVPDELLLHMINLASERLGNHIQYLKINSAVAA
jgi:Rha family phage regulatory protein